MATTHRRGGKHAVRDADLTYTKYDYYTREELLAAVKQAGCYVKDDKKSVMAKKLAKHDQDLQQVARKAAQEQKEREEKLQQEVKDARKARRERGKARVKRNDDRGRRRERGEDASSNSEDTDDVDEQDRNDAQKLTVTHGYALSDETWDDTSSESTVRSKNPPIEPDCRLRLFEWPFTTIPPLNPPSFGVEEFPSRLTYTPLKLTTTQSCEKVTLPGWKYPAGVDPDYVPILDSLTRSAARHGHRIGLLAHASIEPADLWASRTLVQGWNGRMYFALSPCNDIKDLPLDAVYRKWNIENSKLLHPTPGTIDPKTDRKRRFAQRLANKRKAAAEVYEACKWRPLAVSYMPSYLNWEKGMKCASILHHEKSIDSLYYIRFPGCDLPHYYFWARKSEWSNPTIADPAWTPASFEHLSFVEVMQNECVPLDAGVSSPDTLARIEKANSLPTPRHHSPDLASIESDLYTHGLFATLAKYRASAISTGKEKAWNLFTQKLLKLYPSGKLPNIPPVEPTLGMCVAEKIANVLSGCIFLPFTGEESWTRDDNAVWDIVTDTGIDDAYVSEEDGFDELEDLPRLVSNGNISFSDDSDATAHLAEALYRRDSIDALIQTPEYRQDENIYAWLECIRSAYSPHIAPLSPTLADTDIVPEPLSLSSEAIADDKDGDPTCPFCNANWTPMSEFEKAAHMLSHSHISLTNTTTATTRINVTIASAKRRHSRLSITTLRSYNTRRKLLRLDSAIAFAEQWAKLGKEDSPFTKEVRRAHAQERSRALGRRQSRLSLVASDIDGKALLSPCSP